MALQVWIRQKIVNKDQNKVLILNEKHKILEKAATKQIIPRQSVCEALKGLLECVANEKLGDKVADLTFASDDSYSKI